MLTKNIKTYELECNCGCSTTFEEVAPLAVMLQGFRDLVGKPMIITSGCRCEAHNARVGGVLDSMHLPNGGAADFYFKGFDLRDAYLMILGSVGHDRFGLRLYDDFIHFDMRSEPWR